MVISVSFLSQWWESPRVVASGSLHLTGLASAQSCLRSRVRTHAWHRNISMGWGNPLQFILVSATARKPLDDRVLLYNHLFNRGRPVGKKRSPHRSKCFESFRSIIELPSCSSLSSGRETRQSERCVHVYARSTRRRENHPKHRLLRTMEGFRFDGAFLGKAVLP